MSAEMMASKQRLVTDLRWTGVRRHLTNTAIPSNTPPNPTGGNPKAPSSLH